MEPVYILTHTKNCTDNFFPDNTILTYHAASRTYYGDKSFYNEPWQPLITLSEYDLQSIIDNTSFPGKYIISPIHDTIINY